MTAADRPTVPHPDLATLADLDAGTLDPAAAADVAAHVGDCPQCRAAMTAFDSVRSDLRTLPPPAMPAQVVARIDATLAELRRESPGPAPAVPPDSQHTADQTDRTAADLSAARDRKRHRGLKVGGGAVAAAFALIAAGASVTALVTSSDKSDKAATSAAAGASNLSDEEAAPRPNAGSDTRVSGIPSYTKESLSGSLASIIASSAVADVARLGETGPAGAMADPGRRQACVQSIPLREGRLTAARRIEYEGKPAYVFVFTGSASRPTAWVVDDTCGMTGGLPATVLDNVS
jgi:hypothetical protein